MSLPSKAKSPEPEPADSKGCLGCLGMIVLLVVIGFIFRSSWPWAHSLTPEQRAELGRLIGNYQGISSPPDDFAHQWGIVWSVDFSLDDAKQLMCKCAPVLNQNNKVGNSLIIETVHVQYLDSGKPGYIKIAGGSENGGWDIYVEKSVLKSGNEITALLLIDNDFGQCVLNRR